MNSNYIVDCSVYSTQLDDPIECLNCISIDEVFAVISNIPDGIFFDLYLDIYNIDNIFEQKTFSMCGQTSIEEVLKYVKSEWNLLCE